MRPRWRPSLRRGFAEVRARYPAPRRGAELHKRSAEASGETRSKTLPALVGVTHRFARNRGCMDEAAYTERNTAATIAEAPIRTAAGDDHFLTQDRHRNPPVGKQVGDPFLVLRCSAVLHLCRSARPGAARARARNAEGDHPSCTSLCRLAIILLRLARKDGDTAFRAAKRFPCPRQGQRPSASIRMSAF